jgi:hypothetical protein
MWFTQRRAATPTEEALLNSKPLQTYGQLSRSSMDASSRETASNASPTPNRICPLAAESAAAPALPTALAVPLRRPWRTMTAAVLRVDTAHAGTDTATETEARVANTTMTEPATDPLRAAPWRSMAPPEVATRIPTAVTTRLPRLRTPTRMAGLMIAPRLGTFRHVRLPTLEREGTLLASTNVAVATGKQFS